MPRMPQRKYFSTSYPEAVDKFRTAAGKFVGGKLKTYSNPKTPYEVDAFSVGLGPRKIVINAGMHGLEGFFGSAFMLKWLNENADFLSPNYWDEFQITMIHVINGFGMDHRMRENENNVDLNRNFRDWNIAPAPNALYSAVHDLLVSKPGHSKFMKLWHLRKNHSATGVWSAISRGQYEFPDGIFYGGSGPEPQHEMLVKIYDDIMENAADLLSVGLHTGLGDYARPSMLVSHPSGHRNTQKFSAIFGDVFFIVPDEAGNPAAAHLSGDLVDFLEARYAFKNIPIWTADLEMGTGTSRNSPVLKRMDQGDARYEIKHFGKISERVRKNLSEDWFPRNPKWRLPALSVADDFARALTGYISGKSK